jgi:hypothetical protein
VIVVQANVASTDTKIVLRKGDVYLIAQDPEGKWKWSPDFGNVDTTCGYLGTEKGFCKLRVLVKDVVSKDYLAEGEGKLTLSPKDDKVSDNLGSIKVKIIKLR